MAFKPRLFSIPNEKELWKYFEKNARYLEDNEIYSVAGIYSDDTATLFKKLKNAWIEDIESHKDEILAENLSILNGDYNISVEDIRGKKLNSDGFGYE